MVGIIACCHPSHIAAQIGVPLGGNAQRRLECGAERAGREGEHGCVRSRWFRAHEKRLRSEIIRNGLDVAASERHDLIRRVTADAVGFEGVTYFSLDYGGDDRSDRGWNAAEEVRRPFVEILIVEPACLHHRPI